jgi:DNA-binding transcriptional MerR regulator
MKTGGVVKLLGVSYSWVYVLEKAGILTAAAHTASGRRLFDRADVLRVRDERRAAREQRRKLKASRAASRKPFLIVSREPTVSEQ